MRTLVSRCRDTLRRVLRYSVLLSFLAGRAHHFRQRTHAESLLSLLGCMTVTMVALKLTAHARSRSGSISPAPPAVSTGTRIEAVEIGSRRARVPEYPLRTSWRRTRNWRRRTGSSRGRALRGSRSLPRGTRAFRCSRSRLGLSPMAALAGFMSRSGPFAPPDSAHRTHVRRSRQCCSSEFKG